MADATGLDETLKSALIDSVVTLATSIRPDVHIGTKYGGTVFMMNADVANSLVGGVFAYKDHVSVEFSHGVGFSDPDNRLEGKGKVRRHVKLHSLGDLESKDVAGFLRQALS